MWGSIGLISLCFRAVWCAQAPVSLLPVSVDLLVVLMPVVEGYVTVAVEEQLHSARPAGEIEKGGGLVAGSSRCGLIYSVYET